MFQYRQLGPQTHLLIPTLLVLSFESTRLQNMLSQILECQSQNLQGAEENHGSVVRGVATEDFISILSYIHFVLVTSSRTVVVISSSSYQSNLYASNVLKFSVDHVISVLSALYFIAAGID